MFKTGLLAALLLGQPQQFQVAGEVVSRPSQKFEWVDIESPDRRFVERVGIDSKNRFALKKIPAGLYKLIFGSSAGREEYRTIEIRSSFADAEGRVAVRIEIPDSPVRADQFKVNLQGLSVSPKAEAEMRKAYDAGGDVEKVRKHLQKAIEISPNYDRALNNLGTVYYNEGRYDEAAVFLERAIKANPELFAARVNLAGALISLGDFQRAFDEAAKALQIRSDDTIAQAQAGRALFYLKRYEEAMPYLEKTRQADPASFMLPGLYIAEIRQSRGDKEGALAEYREFLRIHPGIEFEAVVERRVQFLERAQKISEP